jgi:hypothetical protein
MRYQIDGYIETGLPLVFFSTPPTGIISILLIAPSETSILKNDLLLGYAPFTRKSIEPKLL